MALRNGWMRVMKATRDKLIALATVYTTDDLAERLGISAKQVEGLVDGTSKSWARNTKDKVVALYAAPRPARPKPKPIASVAEVVHSPPESSLRRLYGLLQTMDASDLVLGAVARFILDEETGS